jgi:glutathione S-transferase
VAAGDRYRLFSWEHSYFSGKARAYLRYKAHFEALGPGYEDILATQELIQGLLVPATGTPTVPQLLTPEGEWIQDSSEIIDVCEARHPERPVIPGVDRPRQRLLAYLLELLGDEWMLVYGFWERWYYSLAGVEPNQRAFNAQQWSAIMPGATNAERRGFVESFFFKAIGIDEPGQAQIGPYSGLVELGVTEQTRDAWAASFRRILDRLEAHFELHDYVLGGRPSLADFGLLAPLYAHIYRDAVPAFELRAHHPLVAEWVERTNGTNALNARSYNQTLYSLVDGELVPRPANTNGGEWLADDEVPDTLLAVAEVFFEEMWPVLASSLDVLRHYLKSELHEKGGALPDRSFYATPAFQDHQRGEGLLTHDFELQGVRGRRMVVPYHVWMLQRLEAALKPALGDPAVEQLLARFPRGPELLELSARLDGVRIRKIGGLLYEEAD